MYISPVFSCLVTFNHDETCNSRGSVSTEANFLTMTANELSFIKVLDRLPLILIAFILYNYYCGLFYLH